MPRIDPDFMYVMVGPLWVAKGPYYAAEHAGEMVVDLQIISGELSQVSTDKITLCPPPHEPLYPVWIGAYHLDVLHAAASMAGDMSAEAMSVFDGLQQQIKDAADFRKSIAA